jgi:pullulanase/glycogen debranching enzyme
MPVHQYVPDDCGPSLCFRGLDNMAYYRLDPGHPNRYYDTTGTGNSLDAGSPVALRLIMDSLRYWLTEMHVDGFRFDLAATLARQDGGFSRLSAFFDLVSQDPVVSGAKLIAEPWDLGQLDSYDLGRFPTLWHGRSDRFADGRRPCSSERARGGAYPPRDSIKKYLHGPRICGLRGVPWEILYDADGYRVRRQGRRKITRRSICRLMAD